MRNYKLVINLTDETKVWINMLHIVKMEKTKSEQYFIYLTSGERYEISRRDARTVEDFLED